MADNLIIRHDFLRCRAHRRVVQTADLEHSNRAIQRFRKPAWGLLSLHRNVADGPRHIPSGENTLTNFDYFSAHQPRVLVVEPHAFQLFDVQNVFFSMGCYRVFPVMTLEDLDAILVNCKETFDLALCTSGAFGLSDRELAGRVCANGKASNLILLTGPQDEEPVRLLPNPCFKQLPLLGFLPKPVSPMSLRAMAERMHLTQDTTLSA
jgi:hypothetical protein